MPDPSDDVPTLDYAMPRRVEPSTELFHRTITLTFFTSGVAVFLLIGFAFSRSFIFALLGLLWLLAGGILTLGTWVGGVVYAGTAHRSRYPGPHTRRRAAIACIAAGAFLMAKYVPHFGTGD